MNTENKTKKVLLMTVGTGATGADIAHGLFFSIKDSNPNLLILIGSSKSFDITLPYLEELIKKENFETEIEKIIIEEINDFEKLHFEYQNIIYSLIKKGFSLNKISVDYTSGTKSMSAALVSAAISLKVGSVLYVYGERGEGGRVKTGTERRSSLSPNKIFSVDVLTTAIDSYNLFRFNHCIELLKNFEFHPDYAGKAELLIKLAEMFDAWDKFDFTRAFEVSKNIDRELLKDFNLKGRFEKDFIPLLIILKNNNLSFDKVYDLVENAKRRASEGKYDDAVARLYRALEMIGQIEFENEFHCSTSDVKLENLPELLRNETQETYQDVKDGKIKIPLFGVFELLKKVKNKTALNFIEVFEQLKILLALRNNSILAHGTIALTKKDFDKAIEILSAFLPDIKENSKFTFPEIKW